MPEEAAKHEEKSEEGDPLGVFSMKFNNMAKIAQLLKEQEAMTDDFYAFQEELPAKGTENNMEEVKEQIVEPMSGSSPNFGQMHAQQNSYNLESIHRRISGISSSSDSNDKLTEKELKLKKTEMLGLWGKITELLKNQIKEESQHAADNIKRRKVQIRKYFRVQLPKQELDKVKLKFKSPEFSVVLLFWQEQINKL